MKKRKIRTFKGRLREDLKDPEFRAHYEEERRALQPAMKIARLREKKGLTQSEFAKLMGTSQQAVSRIESGEYEGFTLKTLEKIAEATGTKLKSTLLRRKARPLAPSVPFRIRSSYILHHGSCIQHLEVPFRTPHSEFPI